MQTRPQVGQIVAHCGHLGGGEVMHWWRFDKPAEMQKPDGSKLVVNWVAGCPQCAMQAKYCLDDLKIRADRPFQHTDVVGKFRSEEA